MSFLRRSSSFGLVVVVLTLTGVARADAGDEPEPDAPRPAREAHDDLLVTGTAGVFADRGDTGGSLGAAVLRQQGWLGYGVTFDYGGKLFDYEVVGAAPMVGLFVDSPRWVRVGLTGSLGVHSYSGVEKGFIASRDPGASGTTGYVGARLFLGGEAGGAARFHFGFQLFAEEDLARVRRTYSFEESSFGGTSPPETVTHTIGAFRCGTLLAIGGAFDL